MARLYRFGDFSISVEESRLRRGDFEIPLQPKVFDALVLFVRRPGELLLKERLLEDLWPDVVVGEEALTQVIRKLRQALGDDTREPRFIQTVMKRGYRFLPRVSTSEPGESDAPPLAQLTGASASIAPTSPATLDEVSRRPRWTLAAVAGTLAALVLVAWWLGRPDPSRPARANGTWHAALLSAQPEREQEAVFAPDGRSYAYEANVDGQFDLHLAMFTGGRRIRLTETPSDDEYYPQYAPDGSSLIFTREPIGGGAPAVWSIPALGGDERLLVADASYGALSPDGLELAYARFLRDGRFALRVRALASGAERELAIADGWLGSTARSPDGARIAYVTTSAVWRVSAASGPPRALRENLEAVRTVAWDPTGGSLLHDGLVRGDGARIWSVPEAGGVALPLDAAPNSSWHPAFSRDGRRLLLTVEHKTRQLWRVGPDGSGLAALPLPTTAECFDVDAAGTHLVYNDWQPASGQDSLALVELASGTTRRLGNGLCPAFSKDGARVAFLAEESGTLDLVVLDLASGERSTVARDFGVPGFVEINLDRRPAWSPDGATLMVERMTAGSGQLVRVEITTGATSPLIEGEVEAGAFSPDGGRYAFCGATPLGSGLHWIDVESGTARFTGSACSYRSAPNWTPTGEGLRLLRGERRRPRIVTTDLEGKELGESLALERPADPAFWGIFDIRPLGTEGWVLLSERYEGDLYLLER